MWVCEHGGTCGELTCTPYDTIGVDEDTTPSVADIATVGGNWRTATLLLAVFPVVAVLLVLVAGFLYIGSRRAAG